jgi:beta-glucosidase
MKNYLLLLLLLPFSFVAQAQTSQQPQLGKDPISKVIAAMTLEEKAQLLVGGNRSVDKTNIVGNLANFVQGAAGMTVSIPRLGIKASVVADGPAGLRIDTLRKDNSNKKYYCTGFPIGSLLASSWNTDILQKVGAAMGNEVREYGCDALLGPALNIHRNPLCGRNFEYYSEDPLISGKMTAAMVRGIQSQGVGATIKHFAANSQQTMRLTTNALISQRALREIYLKGFEIAVKESQPWSIMSSYNKINGVYTHESYPLLTTILRDEWGFKGFVMTDWTDIRNTMAQVHAGNDLMMPGNLKQVNAIIEAVKSGKLSMSDIDRNLYRILEYILKTERFKDYAYSNAPDMEAHALVSREAADEGIVLLKNEQQTLPLVQKESPIALFGIGTYYFFAGGLGSGDVHKAYTINLSRGMRNAGFTPQPQLEKFYSNYIQAQEIELAKVNTPTWHNWFFGFKTPAETAVSDDLIKQQAQDASVAIVTFSRNAGEVLDRHNTEGDYKLTATEYDLLKQVSTAFHAAGKKVIVVLNTGGVMETASWKNLPDAIVLTWQPGQEGGNCVADILTGKVNPSGRLPMTWANDYFDIPSSKNFPYDYQYKSYWDDFNDPVLLKTKNLGYTNYEEGIWIGYRYFNTNKKPVSYPFGYGLSYTTFRFASPKIQQKGNTCTVTVNITNTGSVAGKEVVQLYSTAPKGKLEKPLRELKAFAKTRLLNPGETQTVRLTFTLLDLASFNESSMSWIADAGKYTISLGASVEDIRQTLPFKINKAVTKKVMTKL